MATHRVHYQLGSTGNYRYDITKMGNHEYDALAYFHKKDFPDVEVTRPGTDTDLARVHNTCLMTVNGYVHDTQYINDKLYIPKATASMLRSRANVTGVLDFSNITPTLTKIPLTTSMVTEDLNTLAYDKVFITVPVDVQQPVLIMAGYIVPYDEECFYRVSDNIFALRLSKLSYVEKLYELSRYRDIFKDLNIQVSPLNPEMVDALEVRSLATIRKFLTLHNSFLIDLKTDNLSFKKVFLEHSKIPGTFTTQISPVMPLFTGYGKVSEYSVNRSSKNKYAINTQDCHYNNHLLSRMTPAQCRVYNDHREPGNTHFLSQAFFLDITTER